MKNKKKIRQKFKTEVFNRDKECRFCGEKIDGDNMDAHHITDRSEMPNGGYVKEKGITLCKDKCHLYAEEFHKTHGTEWYPEMHPDDFYALIGSSKELAIEKSLLLK